MTVSAKSIAEAIEEIRSEPAPHSDQLRSREVVPDLAWVYVDEYGRPGLIAAEDDQSEVSRTALKLEYLEIRRGRYCELADNGCTRNILGATIECDSAVYGSTDFFVRILAFILDYITTNGGAQSIAECILRVRELLATSRAPSDAELQGLWAELLTIADSRDAPRMVAAWHPATTEAVDFLEDGGAIEVKSTRGSVRRHSFSAIQLASPPRTLVVSYRLRATDSGTSLFELYDEVRSTSTVDTAKVDRIFLETVGSRGREAGSVRFDRSMAASERLNLNATDVPGPRPPFDAGVENVRFDVVMNDALRHVSTDGGEPEIWSCAP